MGLTVFRISLSDDVERLRNVQAKALPPPTDTLVISMHAGVFLPIALRSRGSNPIYSQLWLVQWFSCLQYISLHGDGEYSTCREGLRELSRSTHTCNAVLVVDVSMGGCAGCVDKRDTYRISSRIIRVWA